MGKQYEKLGLLFVGYSCTLDKLSHLQNKMAFVKVEQALIPHFSKLQRQPAALHTEVIRKLLAGERNVEFIAAPALRLAGKIGQQLGLCRALAHMGEFFVEPQVLLRQFAQQVANDLAMVGAGGGAHVQNASYMQKHHRHRALCLHAHIQYRPWRAGEHLREGLPRPGLGEDVAVSPDILLHDEGAARQHKAHLLHRVPGAEQAGTFGKGADPRPKAGEHAVSSPSEMPEKSAAIWSTGKNSFIKKLLSLKFQPTC